MRTFLEDYWWFLTVGTVAVVFAVVRLRQQRSQRRQSATKPRSFAAIAALSPDELTPFYGSYRDGWREWAGYAYLALFTAVMAYVLSEAFGANRALSLGLALAGLVVGVVAGRIESTTEIIIGPDRIARESALPWFSWSVPLSDVVQCDLIPARPGRMRVITREHGNRNLALTRELWNLLTRRAG